MQESVRIVNLHMFLVHTYSILITSRHQKGLLIADAHGEIYIYIYTYTCHLLYAAPLGRQAHCHFHIQTDQLSKIKSLSVPLDMHMQVTDSHVITQPCDHTFQSRLRTPLDAMTSSTFLSVSGTASLSSSTRFFVQSCHISQHCESHSPNALHSCPKCAFAMMVTHSQY